MRLTILIIAAFVGFAQGSVVLAQPADNTSPEQGATCPPDVKGEPPTVGGGSERQTRPIEGGDLPPCRD